ncbi:hypothetical protein ABD76_16640 [Paenibacillus dendritiformis]|uniref:DUF2357 domain-containing protein n=1 Tax=Paenibacillus dendritiformis TaxID=130049 RepID=UPI0018CEC022|nr:DUF2357 domain-containing protein [Paenibacillus dendritiformis]MBG9794043.1 hypothetical protein [Paenibacillus dendritiformis]
MVIQSNRLPFSLSFIIGSKNKQENKTVYRFYENEKQFFEQIDHPSVDLMENQDIKIRFIADNDHARLYMYGLDMIPSSEVKMDEQGEAYIQPGHEMITLFTKDYYPLIPGGTYQIRVVADNRTWFAPFAILPKQLTFEQLDIMKQQLEEAIRGLAFDFISKRYSQGGQIGKAMPPKLLMQFMIINKHFTEVMAALSDLYSKINFKMSKEYQIVRSDEAKVIDGVTIRHQLKHPELKGHLKAPIRTITYKLPENVWLKRMIRHLISILNEFMSSVEKYEKQLIEEIEQLQLFEQQQSTRNVLREKQKVHRELLKYVDIVQRMKIGFQYIKSAPWYDKVDEAGAGTVPYVLTTDSRYRSIYLLFCELQRDEPELTLDPLYLIQWKRTDLLYEMWAYFEIIKIIRDDLHFHLASGGIFDLDIGHKGALIPSLPEGERVTFEKDDIHLHFIYNGVIPLTSKETKPLEHPLYMRQQHNRPDGRLDVYSKGIYCGSIMMDFKYRPLTNFWDTNRIYRDRTQAMRQLIAYSDCRSNYLYGLRGKQRVTPVPEVWAFYPVKSGRTEIPTSSDDHDICFIPLSPGEDNSYVGSELERVIQQMLKDCVSASLD